MRCRARKLLATIAIAANFAKFTGYYWSRWGSVAAAGSGFYDASDAGI
jgi:hypothetical protein